MGDSEVYTDLKHYPLSTLLFELRPTNSIKLDSGGDVVRPAFEEYAEQYPDQYAAGIPMNRARCQSELPEQHHMTENQIITYRNHNGSTTRYCGISIHGLCPLELLGVFRNPVDYFRYCRIYEKTFWMKTRWQTC